MMMKKQKYNLKTVFKNILSDINNKYIDVIRGDRPSFFTRNRKVTPQLIFLQMFSNTAKSFKNELENFYKNLSLPKNVSSWGFTKQRLKFNPKALVTIPTDYLKSFYEKCPLTKTLKGYMFLPSMVVISLFPLPKKIKIILAFKKMKEKAILQWLNYQLFMIV